jgi:hypothetical protein
MWKNVAMTCFEELSWHIPGDLEENHEKISVRVTGFQAII